MAKKVKIAGSKDSEELTPITPTIIPDKKVSQNENQTMFRIYVGSYEHNLLCLSTILEEGKTPVFQPIFHFEAHALSIKTIAAAKRYLVTGSNDEHIKIYDLQKRKELGTLLGHQGSITCLTFSNEGLIEDEEDKKSQHSGKWLLSGSDDGKIIIWRTKDWEIFGTLKGHEGRVNDLAIHPSGRIAVSVGDDRTIRLWNLMTAKKAANLRIKAGWQKGEFVRWSITGDYFIVGLMNKILIYKTSEAKIVKELSFKTTLMHIETYKLNGVEYLIVGLGNGKIEFYNFTEVLEEEIKPEFELQGHTNRIKDFVLYKNNEKDYLISISSDGNIVIWDLNLKDQIAVYNTGERLICVEISNEDIEKSETMKRRYEEVEDVQASESENEDTEELKRIMNNEKKKKRRNKKNKKITVTLE